MQITKELLTNDILALEGNVENLKAQLAQAVGALTTLKNVREYLEKPEPEVEKEAEKSVDVVEEKVVEKVVDGHGKYVEKQVVEEANG